MTTLPHLLNVHDFTEKTKTFYCPSGDQFSTKSENLQQKTKSECYLKSSCSWTTDTNGCSALSSAGKWTMNSYFEVIIINLYSSEQKFNLWKNFTKFYTMYHVCEYFVCVQPYKGAFNNYVDQILPTLDPLSPQVDQHGQFPYPPLCPRGQKVVNFRSILHYMHFWIQCHLAAMLWT